MLSFFLPYLSKAINRYLLLDPSSNERLAKLNGQVISIQLRPFDITFQCLFYENKIEIQTGETSSAAATISGTPLQLTGVMLTKERHRFFADDLTIEGDAELAQRVIQLFDELEIDWEEYLSRLTGDATAYHVGKFIDQVGGFLNRAQKSFNQNVNEYIHEEAEWLPTREALQDFFTEVDDLRMDVDRLEALAQQLNLFDSSHSADKEPS